MVVAWAFCVLFFRGQKWIKICYDKRHTNYYIANIFFFSLLFLFFILRLFSKNYFFFFFEEYKSSTYADDSHIRCMNYGMFAKYLHSWCSSLQLCFFFYAVFQWINNPDFSFIKCNKFIKISPNFFFLSSLCSSTVQKKKNKPKPFKWIFFLLNNRWLELIQSNANQIQCVLHHSFIVFIKMKILKNFKRFFSLIFRCFG